MENDFLDLIDKSNRILITSHISPDADSIASLLLMGSTLEANFPGKTIQMISEELFSPTNFLYAYDQIQQINLAESIIKYSPDLLIMLDGTGYQRFSRIDAAKVRHLVGHKKIKTAVIDHHSEGNIENADVYINHKSPATAMDVYEICFETLDLKQPKGYAQTALTGIYADSGGFKYGEPTRRGKMLEIAKKLVEAGADIEQIYFQLNRYSKQDFEVLGHLIANLSSADGYNYTWIDDSFIHKWLEHRSQTDLEPGTDLFINEFIRNIDGNQWGFVVYRNTLQGNNYYSVSCRSIRGVRDVSLIAAKLGGGGHKEAAGARFEAASVEAAIEYVKAAIASS
jgi:phosphoesterase RecJ-like protein